MLVSTVLNNHFVPGTIVRLALSGLIVPVLNDMIEKEYREVLSRLKFHLPSNVVEDIVATFQQIGLYIDTKTPSTDLSDPQDTVFYKVVMKNRRKKPLIWSPAISGIFLKNLTL